MKAQEVLEIIDLKGYDDTALEYLDPHQIEDGELSKWVHQAKVGCKNLMARLHELGAEIH
jgi:hypothetical protein